MTLKGKQLEDRFCNHEPSLQEGICWYLLLHRRDGFYHQIQNQEWPLALDGPKPWCQSDLVCQFSSQEFETLGLRQKYGFGSKTKEKQIKCGTSTLSYIFLPVR